MNPETTIENLQEYIGNARELRELLSMDPHRPRYHLLPPEGFFNDANCTIFWNGRYHVFYLGRMPNPNADEWLPVLDHSSSCDLVHWIHHPPAIKPAVDGSMPRGIYSGDAIENAPVPTLIYHVPNQGTCIATSDDTDLVHWTPSPANPVIPIPEEPQEYRVFDPCAWYENGTYYALIGNKNSRDGYEGDATSLFRSDDCLHWEYRGPFYKSSRRWHEVKYPRRTPQDEDGGERWTRSQEAPFKLVEGESLKLHIFLDKSVMEVFVNSRLCLTQRIYPTRTDSLGVSIFTNGGEAFLNRLDAWTMTPTVG